MKPTIIGCLPYGITKFKNKIRKITSRARPFPVEVIIAELNPVLRGWGGTTLR
ncbi:group II intron maturase-specific domain-containing protein [Natroniella acetigena]|uniref:group II intron maturase-specific domain-containing protein n=1 Tax=Natroniella acetigena TaxID=52004 RepID=UPI0031F68B1E